MKKILTLALLGILGASTLSAASKVSQGAEALSKAGENGILVFHYAADWDRYSKKRSDEMMQDSTINAAAGSAIFLPYPTYESPTEAQNKKSEAIRGKIQISTPRSYPAIQMFNKQGYCYYTIQGRELTANSNENVAKLINSKIKALKTQTNLVNQAMETSGVEKATLMGQACKVDEIQFPENALKIIKEADPEDKSGYTAALDTNDYKQAEMVKAMEMDAAISYVKSIMNDKRYTTTSRQGAIAGLMALWRNKGTMDQVPLMKEFCNKSIALNPNYYHAKSANQIKTLWLKEFTADSGWFKTMLPEDSTPVAMTGKIPIKSAGVYTVTMNYTSGKDGLTTKSVTLYDGDSVLAEDVHDGFAGHNPVNNTFTLNVTKTPKNPRLVFVFNQGPDGRNSYGKIDIKKK